MTMHIQRHISAKLIDNLNKQHQRWLGDMSAALTPPFRRMLLTDTHRIFHSLPKSLRDLNCMSYLTWMIKHFFPVKDIATMGQIFEITPAAVRQLEWKATQIVHWMKNNIELIEHD